MLGDDWSTCFFFPPAGLQAILAGQGFDPVDFSYQEDYSCYVKLAGAEV